MTCSINRTSWNKLLRQRNCSSISNINYVQNINFTIAKPFLWRSLYRAPGVPVHIWLITISSSICSERCCWNGCKYNPKYILAHFLRLYLKHLLITHSCTISGCIEVFTLPPLFRPDSGRTPSDSTYPECQFFGSGMAGIVR